MPERHAIRPVVERRAPTVRDWLLIWADVEQRARIIIDSSFTIHWTNHIADQALASGRDLIDRNGRLEPAIATANDEFRAFMTSAGHDLSCLALERKDGDGHFIIFTQKLADLGNQRIYGIAFRGSGGDFEPQWADVSRTFQLTPTEAKVLRLLLDGHVAEKAAAQLSITAETVRSHIRKIYSKMSVSSREQLFRKVAPFLH